MAAVPAESTVEEVKLRGAAITDEVLTWFSESEQLALAESPDVSENAGNVSPTMADPVQRKEHEAAMETPRGVQQRPCRPAATLALRIQLRAASFHVIGRLAFETGPELGQLETSLNGRQTLRSVLLKNLAELVSKSNQRGVFKIELRCGAPILGGSVKSFRNSCRSAPPQATPQGTRSPEYPASQRPDRVASP